MSKTFRRYEPDQMLLMPVALQEWLPSDHLAYFISDVVDQLDLGEIESRYKQEERGYPPYHPLREAHMIVSNAAGKDYFIIHMTNVMVTSIGTGGSGGEDRLTENVTLNFAEVKVEYKPQGSKSSDGVEHTFIWNTEG